MATNSTSKFGFKSFGSFNQKGFGGVRAYFIPSTVAQPVGIGDVVIKTVGTNNKTVYGIPSGVLPTCTPVAADVSTSTAITGVIVGIAPINPFDDMAKQGAASTDRVVYVMEDTNAEFEVCAAESVEVKVGGNCGIKYAAPVNGVSQDTISATATTAGLPFRVIGVVADPESDSATKYIVRINSSTEANATAGLN